jgi:hypothetical protein
VIRLNAPRGGPRAPPRKNFFALVAAIRYNGAMTCKHLKDLYEICETHRLKLSSSDLIRIVCPQCGIEEVCPSVLADEYDTRHPERSVEAGVPRAGECADVGK